MNSRIIFPTNDGGVGVIIPAACDLTIEEIAAKDVPQGKPYKIVDVADIPTDRTFRNAWSYDLTVDIGKAKTITKDRLRTERKPLLEAQDVAFQRALETGASTVDIILEKQRLRDVPQLADSASTLEALSAIHP